MDPVVQAIIGAFTTFIFVSIIFSVVYVICRHRKPPNSAAAPMTRPRHRHDRTLPTANCDRLSSISTTETATFDPSLREVSMQELLITTDNFNTDGIIGDGGFGLVYKAKLYNGVVVALKKLDPNAFQGHREFRAEMETLGKLRHRNIVKMLGYCASGADRVLIYEFIAKGSLDQWLHDTSCDDGDLFTIYPLDWETRVKIVTGVANGLAFMHGLETPIVHRDIKASNVLLDSDFEAHIADFGLARRIEGAHSHVSTQAAGTIGYMPPEYKAGNTAATVKADVYSFGVLMFEVASGRRPNWPVKEEGEEGKGTREVWLVDWAKKKTEANKVVEVVDKNVSREKLRECEVAKFLRIASLCTSEKPKARPAMSEVVDMLNAITNSPDVVEIALQ
ncbi:hypothetical protein Ancab_038582 [Ancistrocladus abbreviatus]